MKIIMNPPYDKNLHLKILNEAIKHSNDVVNLSPIRWLQDPLHKRKSSCDYNKYADIRKHIKSLDIIDEDESNKYFGAYIGTLAIYECSSDEVEEYTTSTELADRVFGIEDLKTYKDYAHRTPTEYWCPVAKYHWTSNGHKDFEPFTLTLAENGTYAKSGWTKSLGDTWEKFYFDTPEEVENLKSMLQLKSYKWLLGKLLVGRQISESNIPMMPTYKHPWTDEMLYEYFNLTEDEIKEIESALN